MTAAVDYCQFESIGQVALEHVHEDVQFVIDTAIESNGV